MTNHDVIIIGAGPAGSFTAYNLAKKGIDVLIIDKERFPRYKVCGGGIPFKVKQIFPFDLSSVKHSEVYDFIFSCRYSTNYRRHSDKLLIECFMRDEFDNMLLQKAVNSGAKLIEQEKVKEIYKKDNIITVRTTGSSITCHIAVGADGSNSVVAKSLGLMQKHVSKAYAIESEIFVDDATFRNYEKTVGLDWGTITNGYGWIFPKNDHLSIGVGGPFSKAKHINAYYHKLLKYLNIYVKETISISGHIIPFRINKNDISTGTSLLVGDAAGLTDPLTGEGIYYALHSGKLAADAIIDYFDNQRKNLFYYQQMVDRHIMPELYAALPIQYIFNLAPLYFHKYLRDSDRLWNAFCRILRGELGYDVVRKKIPASWLFWYPLVASAALFNKLKK